MATLSLSQVITKWSLFEWLYTGTSCLDPAPQQRSLLNSFVYRYFFFFIILAIVHVQKRNCPSLLFMSEKSKYRASSLLLDLSHLGPSGLLDSGSLSACPEPAPPTVPFSLGESQGTREPHVPRTEAGCTAGCSPCRAPRRHAGRSPDLLMTQYTVSRLSRGDTKCSHMAPTFEASQDDAIFNS